MEYVGVCVRSLIKISPALSAMSGRVNTSVMLIFEWAPANFNLSLSARRCFHKKANWGKRVSPPCLFNPYGCAADCRKTHKGIHLSSLILNFLRKTIKGNKVLEIIPAAPEDPWHTPVRASAHPPCPPLVFKNQHFHESECTRRRLAKRPRTLDPHNRPREIHTWWKWLNYYDHSPNLAKSTLDNFHNIFQREKILKKKQILVYYFMLIF